ncbi:MAG TPA: thiamine phosphate synthase [Chitinophaga sp.]|uniref:thiamine phosphate synthase n=1 Tax=Chitinophaga sp. TaxID=1869181 RepID=UPI002C217CE1|nr:thiamine phosphate synthase [Chitinophaga sp.]HVI46294.1 thiamine phosphate synthase [Chitinophaga sp.]
MIWAITSPERVHEEVRILSSLLEAGADGILLRKPGWNTAQYEALVETIDPRYYQRLIIRDNFQVCNKYALGGIHLSEQMRESISASALLQHLQPYSRSSTGVHNVAQLVAHCNTFNTLLLSPVFDSISKPGYQGRFERLPLSKGSYAVLALGGVDSTNIESVQQWGFDGAAVLGALWKDPARAVASYHNMQQLWKKNAHTH